MRITLLLALAACSTPPPIAPSNTWIATRPASVVLASPGYVMIEGGSKTFVRAIRLAEKGDHWSALVELSKVIQAESNDSPEVRAVAYYNFATLCLEQGFFTKAGAMYAALVDREPPIPDALLVQVATGLGVLHDRIGKTEQAIDPIRNLSEDVIARVPGPVKAVLKGYKHRALGTPPDPNAISRDVGRIKYELELLRSSDRAFQTTTAAADILQDTAVQASIAEDMCQRVACQPLTWTPPENPRPSGMRTL